MDASGKASRVISGSELVRRICERLVGILRIGFRRKPPRKLRICETLSLGNRGFLAVVRYQEQQFLVGGTNQSIAMLAQLNSPPPAHEESKANEKFEE